MKARQQYFNPATGQWHDGSPDGILPDGGRLRVPMEFMDAMPPDVAQRTHNVLQGAEAAYDAMCHDLDPLTPVKSSQFDTPRPLSVQDAESRRAEAYEASTQRLTDAWRTGGVQA